jgi:hypothetical protein
MAKPLDHYQFDLREEGEEVPTLDEFRQMMVDMAAKGWEFAGAVTLNVVGVAHDKSPCGKNRSGSWRQL